MFVCHLVVGSSRTCSFFLQLLKALMFTGSTKGENTKEQLEGTIVHCMILYGWDTREVAPGVCVWTLRLIQRLEKQLLIEESRGA